jgi:N-glycosylase/DNA lyase
VSSSKKSTPSLVQAGFRRAGLPLTRSLRNRIPERAWKRIARERGIGPQSKASDLDVFDWVALFALVWGTDAQDAVSDEPVRA